MAFMTACKVDGCSQTDNKRTGMVQKMISSPVDEQVQLVAFEDRLHDTVRQLVLSLWKAIKATKSQLDRQ